MNIFQAITTRKSIKKFSEKPVDDKLIGLMLHMATYAHSAGNLQEWEFIVVDGKEVKEKLAEAALKQSQIVDAPVDIVVCADLDSVSMKYGKRGEVFYALQDTASATTNMLLAANALGVGTSWIAAFDEESVKIILGLPDNLRPVAIIAMGYPAEESENINPNSFEEVTYLNKYGNKIFIEFKPVASALERTIKDMISKYRETKQKKKFNLADLLKK